MKVFREQRGLTLIETMFSATIVAFMMLGMMNLITTAYKGLITTRLKTIAYEAASESL
jgi:Tfp pilus assembly protein PilV